MRKFLSLAFVLAACSPSLDATQSSVSAETSSIQSGKPVRVMGETHALVANDTLVAAVRGAIALDAFRGASVRAVSTDGAVSHLIVHLLSATHHKVELARLDVDAAMRVTHVTRNYRLHEGDSPEADAAVCPDNSVQFVSLCPNDDQYEIGIANGVADYAESKGLKTVRLMKEKATGKAWLNYMACPNLLGNFYDGDANTELIVVYNGELTAHDLEKVKFKHQVTNIWLACEAYNDPMLTAVRDTAQSHKYAAGINDLLVGPSDETAACAMKAAIDGSPMTAAFDSCKAQKDDPQDQWGWGGDGTDLFFPAN